MPEIPIVSAKRFLRCLILFGCEELGVKGSHHKVRYIKTGRISVVPVHSGKDVKRGLFAAILTQLHIDIDSFIEFMAQS